MYRWLPIADGNELSATEGSSVLRFRRRMIFCGDSAQQGVYVGGHGGAYGGLGRGNGQPGSFSGGYGRIYICINDSFQ